MGPHRTKAATTYDTPNSLSDLIDMHIVILPGENTRVRLPGGGTMAGGCAGGEYLPGLYKKTELM